MGIVVTLHSVQELLSTLRVTDVLYANVDALFNVAISDYLVNDNTNGMRSDVIHNSGPSVKHVKQS